MLFRSVYYRWVWLPVALTRFYLRRSGATGYLRHRYVVGAFDALLLVVGLWQLSELSGRFYGARLSLDSPGVHASAATRQTVPFQPKVGRLFTAPTPVVVAPQTPPVTPPAPVAAPPAPPPARTPAVIVRFRNSYAFGNCTYYVAQRRLIPNNWGHAYSWFTRARSAGFTVGTQPQVGAIAWTPAGAYGHVALVEGISGNGVLVSEMNYTGYNRISRRWVSPTAFKYIY